MKIGFSGTRMGMSQHQKEQFVLKIQELGITEFHHGDCEGADSEAHDIVREFFPDVIIVGHLPLSSYLQAFKKCDKVESPLDYLKRDKKIVDDTVFLIAAPLSDIETKRSGTWYTIRYARQINRPHYILER